MLGKIVRWKSKGSANKTKSKRGRVVFLDGEWYNLEREELLYRRSSLTSRRFGPEKVFDILVKVERKGKNGQPLVPWYYAPFRSKLKVIEREYKPPKKRKSSLSR